MSRRSYPNHVPQFEARRPMATSWVIAVPEQLCAGRVALASEPPAEAPNLLTDRVAEARRRRQLA